MERVSIYIDSGNFYHLVLRKLGFSEAEFDFEKFAYFLARERIVIEKGKRFYVGTVRELENVHETKTAMAAQTKLFSYLKSNNWEIKTSKLRTRQERITVDDRVVDFQKLKTAGFSHIEYSRSREKGIDVKLAVDLLVGALDDKYDTAIVASSDTDLVPAIDIVRHRFKKKIEYVGFSIPQEFEDRSTRPTKRMIYATDVQRVLTPEDITPFCERKH